MPCRRTRAIACTTLAVLIALTPAYVAAQGSTIDISNFVQALGRRIGKATQWAGYVKQWFELVAMYQMIRSQSMHIQGLIQQLSDVHNYNNAYPELTVELRFGSVSQYVGYSNGRGWYKDKAFDRGAWIGATNAIRTLAPDGMRYAQAPFDTARWNPENYDWTLPDGSHLNIGPEMRKAVERIENARAALNLSAMRTILITQAARGAQTQNQEIYQHLLDMIGPTEKGYIQSDPPMPGSFQVNLDAKKAILQNVNDQLEWQNEVLRSRIETQLHTHAYLNAVAQLRYTYATELTKQIDQFRSDDPDAGHLDLGNVIPNNEEQKWKTPPTF